MKKFIKIAYVTLLIGFWYFFANFTYPLLAQGVDKAKLEQVKKAVVKITSKKPDDVVDTGTGIITWYNVRKRICLIMTAYHVVEEAEQISVQFFHDRTTKWPAKMFEQYDEAHDFAVILVSDIEPLEKIDSLEAAHDKSVKELDNIFTIGHPAGNDWYASSGEIRASQDILHFAFTREAIDPGNSGGPLLNDKFQLIGMVTHKTTGDGQALKINHVVEILESWGLPHFLRFPTIVIEPSKRRKWWYFGAGGIVVAGGVAAYIFLKPNNGSNGIEEDLPLPPDPAH